jgi:hypothetical protein
MPKACVRSGARRAICSRSSARHRWWKKSKAGYAGPNARLNERRADKNAGFPYENVMRIANGGDVVPGEQSLGLMRPPYHQQL